MIWEGGAQDIGCGGMLLDELEDIWRRDHPIARISLDISYHLPLGAEIV